MEIMELYDKHRTALNETAVRGTKLPEGKYRVVVHICVFNEKNQMLVQQRQSCKKAFPNLWDITAGGQVSYGETSEQGAERELYEELGIHIDMSQMRPSFTMNFNDGFDDIYLIRNADIDLNSLKLQEEEVQNAKWASQEEILSMIEDKTFINYHKSYIALLFTTFDENGSFSEN